MVQSVGSVVLLNLYPQLKFVKSECTNYTYINLERLIMKECSVYLTAHIFVVYLYNQVVRNECGLLLTVGKV